MKNAENSKKTRTNADRIRELPNEVLAQILNRYCISFGCKGCVLKKFCDVYRSSGDWLTWLESEAEEIPSGE